MDAEYVIPSVDRVEIDGVAQSLKDLEDSYEIPIGVFLTAVVMTGSSDLHIVPKHPISVRKDGVMEVLKLMGEDGKALPPLYFSPIKIDVLLESILTERERDILHAEWEYDFAIDHMVDSGEYVRFRANYYYVDGHSLAATFRIIPSDIKSLDDLRCPAVFKEIIKKEKGLILVTGPTGSGKSTTLAAMINEINETEKKHIITIEHPVEFKHPHKKCVFSYRGVGEDTRSFSAALRGAMREDPDIILIGEMRDKETIQAAITAAETGHLVLATLHTNSVAQTVSRIIDTFEGSEQAQVRSMLSVTLHSIISQSLLPRIGGGRVAIYEVLISNPAVSNLIREDKLHQLYSQMQLNQQQTCMQTQTQALMAEYKRGTITKEAALRFSTRIDELAAKISGSL